MHEKINRINNAERWGLTFGRTKCRTNDISELQNYEYGWGSTFRTTKCRTTNISKFRNSEYENNERWDFFNFKFIFLFLYLFKLFEHLKYIIIYESGNLWNFNSFSDYDISKFLYSSKWYNLGNFWNFPSAKFLEIFQIDNVWNYLNFEFLDIIVWIERLTNF